MNYKNNLKEQMNLKESYNINNKSNTMKQNNINFSKNYLINLTQIDNNLMNKFRIFCEDIFFLTPFEKIYVSIFFLKNDA